MHEHPDNRGAGTDPLGEIIRAAGRRSAPPEEHYDQVYAAARRAWRTKVRSRRRTRWLALAASVAVIAGGGLVALWLQSSEPGNAARVAVAHGSVELYLPDRGAWEALTDERLVIMSGSRLRTSDDGRIALALADGGSLRLAETTEIVFDSNNAELLGGKVYFDSYGRPPALSLAIETTIGSLRDIGTQYEAELRDGRLRVRVREGAVAIAERDTRGAVSATVGEEIELTLNGMGIRRRIAADDPAWAWAQSLASVPEVPSQSILTYLQWIARETGKRLEFERGAELQAQFATFGGNPAGLAPLELLSAIVDTSDFRANMTADGKLLIGRNAD